MSLFKKFLSFFFICFFILFLTVISVKVKASTKTDTYTFTSKAWAATLNDKASNWTSKKDGGQLTQGQGVQVTANCSGAGATSPREYSNVTKIVVNYCTNASKGAGSINLTIGDKATKSQNVTTDGGTTLRSLTYDYGTAESGSINLTVTCTTNSIYVSSIEITYEVGGDTPADPIAVTSVSLDKTDVSLEIGDKLKLKASIEPNDATIKNVTWSSSNEKVATVDNGLVTAVSEGTANITVTTEDGSKQATCSIKVQKFDVETVTFSELNYKNEQEISSYKGDNFRITFDKGSNNNNAPKYYTNGTSIRLYGGNEFTISSIDNVNKILNINIEFASGDGNNAITASPETYNTGIWTGNASTITFSVGVSSGNNRRIASITVKCEPRLSINFNANGGTGDNPTTIKVTKECNSSELPTPSYIYSKHNFVGWNTKADGTGISYSVGDKVENVQEDITLYAQWEEVSEIESLKSALNNIVSRISASYKLNYFSNVDLLNFDFIGVVGTSYKDWSDKDACSSAIYSGNTAGNFSSIQLRNTDNSGIVTSSSGGNAKKISVVWNSNTASGKTIEIYGKNTAYSDATDLYNDSNKGDLLGTISVDNNSPLEIDGDYKFIGIKSTNKGTYLDQIRIEWNDGPLYEVAEDSDFRLKLGADLDLANVINQLEEEHRADADYGIELSYKETTKFISFKSSQTGLYEDNVKNIKYILISLGTMFDNTKADATTEFTVKPCVKYDGNTYYSNHAEGSKTYSYASMIKAYYADNATKEAVEPLYYIMQQKGLIA